MRLSCSPFLSIVLALLTLLVQQGALRHEFAHELGSRTVELRGDDGAPPASVCEDCLAYAAVGAALPAAVQLPPAVVALPALPASPVASMAAALPRTYLARAPPSSRPS